MSENTKWTPGPWVACPGGDVWTEDVCCKVADAFNSVEADSNLIAAAPALYQELEIMESILTYMIEDGYTGYVDRRYSVRKALAKARGES